MPFSDALRYPPCADPRLQLFDQYLRPPRGALFGVGPQQASSAETDPAYLARPPQETRATGASVSQIVGGDYDARVRRKPVAQLGQIQGGGGAVHVDDVTRSDRWIARTIERGLVTPIFEFAAERGDVAFCAANRLPLIVYKGYAQGVLKWSAELQRISSASDRVQSTWRALECRRTILQSTGGADRDRFLVAGAERY